MNNYLNILSYGLSHVPDNWVNMMNQTQLVDRLYYIVREGAGYTFQNEKHYFMKNHLYFISHLSEVTFFVEDNGFYHAYIDYTDSDFRTWKDIIEIFPQQGDLLKADVDTFICFLKNKSIKGINFHEHKEQFNQYKGRIKLMLESFVCDAEEIYPQKIKKQSPVSESIQYIHKNFEKDISVHFLAKQAHLSKNQYTRLFFRDTGMTPYQYIKNYRMDVAIFMLRHGIAIGEIAERCGFLSASAFSSSFKQQFGCAPSVFIK